MGYETTGGPFGGECIGGPLDGAILPAPVEMVEGATMRRDFSAGWYVWRFPQPARKFGGCYIWKWEAPNA